MGPEVVNKLKDSDIHGDFVGRDKITNIIMYQESEREFVITRNANIKPVSYFTGRVTELKELRQRIEEGRKSVLVSGMGGIGKTHICRKLFEEYLNRHAENENCPFRHIGYIEYSGDMASSLQSCLKFKQQEKPEQNQEAAWRELEYLASDGKLLLFVDNVDKTIGADPGLQRLKEIPGAVVLTSRQASFSDEFEPYRIGFLDVEQCKEIYTKIRFEGSERKVNPEEIGDLEYIIESLAGRHTITVELLAHLARTKLWTVKRLREELEEKGFRLAFRKDGEFVNIQESYEVLYDLSKLAEAEQNILEAFSVFPYIPLAAETCNEWLLADAGVSEDDDVLMGLYQKGWLQFDWEQEGYTLHPVFAQFIYDRCKPTKERHSGLIDSCRESLMPELDLIIEGQRYISFAENIIEKLNLKTGSLIRILDYVLKCKHDLAKEENLLTRNVINYEEIYGINSYHTACAYSDLAKIYVEKKEYERAIKLYEKCLRVLENELGEEHELTVTCRDELADVYMSQGNNDKAKEILERSLQRNIMCNSQTVALSYEKLAFMYMHQEEYGKAEEMFEKGLDIMKEWETDSKCNIYLCWAYIKLAGVCLRQEKYEKTKGLCDRAWEFCGTLEGDYGIIASAHSALAKLYVAQKEFCRARELNEKSLEMMKKLYGENHLDVANNYDFQAEIYYMQNEYGKAEELYKRSIRIRESILGENHLDTATSYNNLAIFYFEQGEYEKAEELFEKSLRIQKSILGENHPNTSIGYNNLVLVYIEQGEYEKAEELFEKSLRIQKSILGENHSDSSIDYNNLALAHLEQEEYEKAEKLYEKGLRIQESILGENHPNTATNYNNLAFVYMRQGEYKKATIYCLKAYKSLSLKLGLNHPNTQTIYKNLEMIYSEWNQDGDFDQWLEEKMKEEE